MPDQRTCWNRPARRSEAKHGNHLVVTWSIDGEVVVVLEVRERGPAHVKVHDVGIWRPLRQRLRTCRAVLERVEREA